MRLATITDGDAFAALAPEWDGLVRAMPRPSPFLLHGWLLECWRHHEGHGTLAVHVAFEHGRLTGALPLLVRHRLGLRVARFLGEDGAALADVLCADDRTAAALLRRAAANADLVDLFGVSGSSRLAAVAPPGELTLVERSEAPVLELPGGWDAAYRAKTSARRRSLHRRRRRQLEDLGELRFELAAAPAELEPALEAAFRLHALRWQDRPEASGFATEAGRRFHRAALQAMAAAGAARIALLRLDGRVVACNYFFLLERRMYFHELAFDPAVGRFSPGTLTTLWAIECAAAEGARRVEFLGGAEPYKLELADRLEPLHEAVGLATTTRGRAAAAARAAAIRARRRLKHSPVRDLYYDGLAPARRMARLARSSTSARLGTSAPGRSPARMP